MNDNTNEMWEMIVTLRTGFQFQVSLYEVILIGAMETSKLVSQTVKYFHSK